MDAWCRKDLLRHSILSFLKTFFSDASQIKLLKSQLKKFKYNITFFNRALKNQPRYAAPDKLMPEDTTMTVVSNPFCGPCAKAHETLDQWLKTRDDVKLKIVFITADQDDDEKTKFKFTLNLMEEDCE